MALWKRIKSSHKAAVADGFATATFLNTKQAHTWSAFTLGSRYPQGISFSVRKWMASTALLISMYVQLLHIGKSAQGTLNPMFPRAGGTLINQGTLTRQMIFTTILVHVQGRVIDLRIGRASSREAGCTATAGVVPTRVIVRCGICMGNGEGERFGLKFF